LKIEIPLKFILQAGNWYSDWKIIERAVPEADRLGFWGFVMPDHYMWGSDRGGDSTLETWIALPYIAAKTEQIHLGTVVTPIPFRPPGMLAKELSTLDIISGGRVLLGVGAGWSETEFRGYSTWDGPKVRVDKTLEGLELILKLWQSKEKFDWSGKYYHAEGVILEPKPIQSPHPPLLFGGISNRMLRMAGKHADICLIPSWAQLGREESKRIVLESARKNGREDKVSFASLSFSREGYDRKQASKLVSEAQDQGNEYFIQGFPRSGNLEAIKDFATEIMPSYG
jgi:alkanesulfonate monooxygenase SsuD/methylene tetrahydromethanopterin reductase-like flavin-dependent oxidoreductase (luciferase family)